MKKGLLIVSFLIGFTTLFAQDCEINRSLYYESYKIDNFQKAYEPWRKVFDNCPADNKEDFIFGEAIVRGLIEANPMEQNKYVDVLWEIYNKRATSFPEDKCLVASYKADDIIAFGKGTNADALAKYKEAFTKDCKQAALGAESIYNYFKTSKNMLDAGELQHDEVLEAYDKSIDKLESTLNYRNVEIAGLETKRDSLGGITTSESTYLEDLAYEKEFLDYYKGTLEYEVEEILTCDRIIPIYETQFDANHTNVDWLKSTATILSRKECTETPFFERLVDAHIKNNPAPESKAMLARKQYNQRNYSAAYSNFQLAIDGENDRFRRASYYYFQALIKQKQGAKSAARSKALKAASERPGWGNPYLLIAGLYGSSANACGNDEFSKRAVYWVAADMAAKAKRIDPSVAYNADRMIRSYLAKAPDQSLIFRVGKSKGSSHRVGCWIGASTTIR